MTNFIRPSRAILAASLFAVGAGTTTLYGVPRDLTWGNGAATGLWNGTDANWTGATWDNGRPDNAFFTSAGGSVTLDAITAGSVNLGNADIYFPSTTFSGTSLTADSLTVQGHGYNNGSYANNPTLTLNLATVAIAGDMAVGRANLVISGGNVSADRIITSAASADWGRLVIADGSTVTATHGVDGSVNTGATFQLDLNGGELCTPSIRVADREDGWENNAYLTFNGGKVTAIGANNADFITLYGGNQNCYVGAGGAKIDTNNYNIGIRVNLLDQGGGLTKSGAGMLTLLGNNTYRGDTTVTGGSLTVGHPATGTSVLITNAGFETPVFDPGGWNYLADDGIGGWSFTGGGIAANGSPWVDTPAATQAGFVQDAGSMSHEISVPADSYFVLSFQAANRPGYGASGLQVQIDGIPVAQWGADQLNTGGEFVGKSAPDIFIGAGTHTLKFQGIYPGDATATAIDNVTLTDISAGRLTFYPTSTNTSNKITGTGNPAVTLNNEIYLDLAAADLTDGNTWLIVDSANVAASYGGSFSVNSSLGAFTNNAGVWTLPQDGAVWTFDQATGQLGFLQTTDAFLGWINTTWPTLPDKSPTGDPDQDGIPNLLEYVLRNGDPSVGSTAILPTSTTTATDFVFTFYRRTASTTDTTQTFEYSDNLTDWNPLAIPGAGVVVTDIGGGIDEVVITVPRESHTKLFGRVNVTKP